MDVTAGCYIWYGPDFSRRDNFTRKVKKNSGGLPVIAFEQAAEAPARADFTR